MSEQRLQNQNEEPLDDQYLEEGTELDPAEDLDLDVEPGVPYQPNTRAVSSGRDWLNARRVESDPADFTSAVTSSYEALRDFGSTSEAQVSTASKFAEPAVDSIDKGLDKSGRKVQTDEAKPEEDVDAAREAVEKSLKTEETAREEAPAAPDKIRDTAESAARPVKRRSKEDRRTRSQDASRAAADAARAKGEAKRTAEAPQTPPIMGERDGAAEKPPKQTVVNEGTDGQQYIAEPTTERPKQARVPKQAATEARQVPDAVIPTQEQPEPTAPEEPLGTTREEQIDEDVLSAMGGYDSGRPAKRGRGRKARHEEATEEATTTPVEPVAEPEAPRRPSPADMPGARGRRNGPSPADMPRRRPTTESVNDQAPVASTEGSESIWDTFPGASEEAPVAYGSEWGTFVGDDSESDAPAMSPDEARASAHRRMGEPERTFGQPHSDETAAYLKTAGPAETGTPYVKSDESSEDVAAKPAEENKSLFSDTEVFARDDSEMFNDHDSELSSAEAELLRTAGNRDTRTPEEVEADDAAAEIARTAEVGADPMGAMRNSARNRLGGFGDRSRSVGSTALTGEDDSWADSVFGDLNEESSSPWDVFSSEPLDDPLSVTRRGESSSDDHEDDGHDNDDDDNEAGRSLGDDLFGDADFEPTRSTRRERVGAAFRTGWNKARDMLRLDRNDEPDEYSTRPRGERNRGARHSTLFMTGISLAAGAAVLGLVSSSANSGAEGNLHDQLNSKPKASAPAKPGAKVDSGKTEAKPSESATDSDKKESKKPNATVDDDHRHEHGTGTPDVSHTFDVGRETVKVSTDNEVVVTLKQGGTVWDALDKIGDELHINHSDEDIAETVQSMHLKPGQDRQMKVGSSYTFKVQGGKLVAKK